MIDLVVVLNDKTKDLFPEVAWRRYRDAWVAEVKHDLAVEIAKAARKAGLSVGEKDASEYPRRKRLSA